MMGEKNPLKMQIKVTSLGSHQISHQNTEVCACGQKYISIMSVCFNIYLKLANAILVKVIIF